MTDKRAAWGHLATHALTPDYLQWFICYSTAKQAGLQMCCTWSPDREATVRQMFEFDFYDEQPEIHFVCCPGSN
ncbi:MAG: hypothetical protein EOO37_00120 [Cytophagaceae bacterium]|nr:MAG: hypothetical protein EOO37_00120 [Cytophagaceae bacterium]